MFDVAGRQMNAGVKTAGKTMELLKPFPFLPLAELTREGVKSYVDHDYVLAFARAEDPRAGPAQAAHRLPIIAQFAGSGCQVRDNDPWPPRT